MQIVSFTEARNNLKSIMDNVCANYEPTAITRRNGEPVVMIPLSEWNNLEETDYILRTEANRKNILRSLREIEEGKTINKKLVEVESN